MTQEEKEGFWKQRAWWWHGCWRVEGSTNYLWPRTALCMCPSNVVLQEQPQCNVGLCRPDALQGGNNRPALCILSKETTAIFSAHVMSTGRWKKYVCGQLWVKPLIPESRAMTEECPGNPALFIVLATFLTGWWPKGYLNEIRRNDRVCSL